MTQPTKLGAEPGPRFTNYRAVPWVNRTHAVVALPSAGALVTLRQLPPGKATQRTFAGFGDPYFSRGQARLATLHQEEPADAPAVNLRDARLIAAGSRRLDMLPRLPDTAEEIQSIARAMNADLTQDVFLGRRANEQAVKGLDLVRYRVVAFATHGLSPRDLDGLSQPALALTAPEVAGIEGDGLLTLEEILGLRLNADWVVLSACNTGSGSWAESEALWGLGQTFFYAGARALLVSNWAIETASARALTTDLFRRYQSTHGLTRAKALQQEMNAMIDSGGFVDSGAYRLQLCPPHLLGGVHACGRWRALKDRVVE